MKLIILLACIFIPLQSVAIDSFPDEVFQKVIKFQQTKGSPLLVDFWASWCGPCKESFPEYNKLYKDFSAKVNFIAINEDSDIADQDLFLKNNTLNLKNYHDINRQLSKALEVNALPTLFIFDKNGKLVLKLQGFHKDKINNIRKILSQPDN